VKLAAVASGYAFVAAYAVIGLGVELQPDTASYSSGGSGWSSAISAMLGGLGGRVALDVIGIGGAVLLGVVVAREGGYGRSCGLLAAMTLAPHFPGLCASPDALGAAAAVYAYPRLRPGRPLISVTALVHLQAACVLLVVDLGRRAGVKWHGLALLAGVGSIVALALIGLAVGVRPDELQVRYLLPGAAILAAYARPRPWIGLAAAVTP